MRKFTDIGLCLLLGAVLLIAIFVVHPCDAQIKQPVRWHTNAVNTSGNDVVITFTAVIDEPWHIYSQFMVEGGPVPTKFEFAPSDAYELMGKVREENEPMERFDPTFQMPVLWFEGSAVFTQPIRMKRDVGTVSGTVTFMACTDQECLLPEEKNFSIAVNRKQPRQEKGSSDIEQPISHSDKKKGPQPAHTNNDDTVKTTRSMAADQATYATTLSDSGKQIIVREATSEETKKLLSTIPEEEAGKSDRTLLAIFLAGFAGGLAAFLMPCVFPMVPFIIGSFARANGGTRSARRSVVFGVSIIVIYVTLGLAITLLFGSDALNDLSTNGVFNFFFFILLAVFAASFLGAFEITLPSSWVRRADEGADRNGWPGIFFMAGTLALVSFSCTGPIIGTLLVETARMGKLLGPVTGMTGFSLALALPFATFSLFPSWLKSLPRSGAWMNTLKVTLGFLELALALKFLSNVDLAYHWNWFGREVFLVLWIVIFSCLGLYLLGKLKLPHDNGTEHLSPFRLIVAMVTMAFSLYMVPGLWGAPLKAVAAFLPPQHTQDFDLYSSGLGSASNARFLAGGAEGDPAENLNRKYSDLFHAPLNLNAFFDYEEGLTYARRVGKPVLVDFTGHACVNCRKMEATIWPEPSVLEYLRNQYVLIELYVDDKTELPQEEQAVSAGSGKLIKTIGNKWSELQASVFNSNSQPYYVLLDHHENILLPPKGADYDAASFADYLERGVSLFKEQQAFR